MPRKVGKAELRRLFNEAKFRESLIRRTNQRVDVSINRASAECQQEPGTESHVYDWMEYVPGEDRMRLLATVHQFRRPDGTIGGSGQPDPIVVVVDGVPHTDP